MKGFLLGMLLALVSGPAAAGVDASQYNAFWLWSGVHPQPVLAQA